jgi:hypothetical protein
MKKGNLSREQAIKAAGLAAVRRVESENCEPTNRVGYNGNYQGDSESEWSASVAFGDGRTLLAYYYISNDQEQEIADHDGDGGAIDWEIAGYEID